MMNSNLYFALVMLSHIVSRFNTYRVTNVFPHKQHKTSSLFYRTSRLLLSATGTISSSLSTPTQVPANTTQQNVINNPSPLSSQPVSQTSADFPQSMDYTSIIYATHELQHLLLPSKVENIIQEDAYNLFIAFKTMSGGSQWLQLSWHPKSSWFSIVPQLPPTSFSKAKASRLSFESALFSLLHDLTLVKITTTTSTTTSTDNNEQSSQSPNSSSNSNNNSKDINHDRVIVLEFSERLSATSSKYKLYFEIVGIHSNIILVNSETNIILTCGYQVGGKSQRQIQTSGLYQILIPPTVNSHSETLNKLLETSRGNSGKDIDSTSNNSGGDHPNDIINQFRTILTTNQPSLSPASNNNNNNNNKVSKNNTQHTVFRSLLRLSSAMSPNIAYSMLQSISLDEDELAFNLSDNQLIKLWKMYSSWYNNICQLKDKVLTFQTTLENNRISDGMNMSDNIVASDSNKNDKFSIQPYFIETKGSSISSNSMIKSNANKIKATAAVGSSSSSSLTPSKQLRLYSIIKFNSIDSRNQDDNKAMISSGYDPSQFILLKFFNSHYYEKYRTIQFKQLKIECLKKVVFLQDKSRKLLNVFEKAYFEATSGKSEELRYTADLLTSYIHTAKILRNNKNAEDGNNSDDHDNYNVKNRHAKIDVIADDDDSTVKTVAIKTIKLGSTATTTASSSSSTVTTSTTPATVAINKNKLNSVYQPVYIVNCIDFITQENIDYVIDYNGLNAQDYIKYLYKKSKKIKKSKEKLDRLISQARSYMEYLDELDMSIDVVSLYTSYNDILVLKEISDELDQLKVTNIISVKLSSDGEEEEENDCSGSSGGGAKESSNGKKVKGNVKSNTKNKEKDVKSKNNKNNNNTELSSSSSVSKKKLLGLLVLSPSVTTAAASTSSSSSTISGSYSNTNSNSNISNDIDNNNASNINPWATVPSLVIGRNSKQNDRVSFDIAKPHHVWFHVQGCPGSHCLLLMESSSGSSGSINKNDSNSVDNSNSGGKSKGQQKDKSNKQQQSLSPNNTSNNNSHNLFALQFAADMAAYFSQARGSTQVAVGYCSPRNIKRAPGGKPGLVLLEKSYEGTLYGRPDRGEQYFLQFAPKD